MKKIASKSRVNDRRLQKKGHTRQLLLETAGEVFARVGFEAASGRDICDRAKVNPAAINYYFGGIEGLHEAVIDEAHSRIVGLAPVLELIGSTGTAVDRLVGLFRLLINTALSTFEGESWPMKVLAREALGSSEHLDVLRETELVPKLHVIRSLVAEAMELPEDHPAVSDGCLAYLSASVMLHMADRKAVEKAFPSYGLANGSDGLILTHFTEFMLGGIERLAQTSKRNPEKYTRSE